MMSEVNAPVFVVINSDRIMSVLLFKDGSLISVIPTSTRSSLVVFSKVSNLCLTEKKRIFYYYSHTYSCNRIKLLKMLHICDLCVG